jgi:hypothetical protein
MKFTAKDEQTRLRMLLDHYAAEFPNETRVQHLARQQGLLLGMLAQVAARDWTVSRDISLRLEQVGLDHLCRPLKKK